MCLFGSVVLAGLLYIYRYCTRLCDFVASCGHAMGPDFVVATMLLYKLSSFSMPYLRAPKR